MPYSPRSQTLSTWHLPLGLAEILVVAHKFVVSNMDHLDALTDDQREVLQSFQGVTGIDDIERSLSLLTAYEWNLEQAVQGVFDDGPVPQPIPSANGSSSSTSNLRSRIPQASSTSGRSNSPAPSSGVPAPPPRPGAVRTFTFLQRLTYPFSLGLRIAWVIVSFTLSLFPFNILQGPRRRTTSARRRNLQSTDPQAAAARFLLDFEVAYGVSHPNFFQGTYSQALDVAKRELRYLFVYLQSSDHDDTPDFNRNTMTSERFINYIQEQNFLVWAGDIKESESFLVSNVLLATRYPFIALIAPQGSRMVVVDRVEGPSSPEELITALSHHVNRFDSNINAIRADRERQDQARSIREQQDQAYQASLRADQEKERKAQEERDRIRKEKEEAEKLEMERENKIEMRMRRREELRQNLPVEPAATAKDIAKISLRLPSGERVVRRFNADDKIELVYNFIESMDLSPISIEADIVAVNTYPRKVLLDKTQTLKEAGLVPSASLIVEEKDEDD
ncbi:hypothetical protein BC829DRAFT_182361 [Chytridium lagenaria]|nr:hypothetical protein BC829DRAFT_182361 [Chytridium lagenaria]